MTIKTITSLNNQRVKDAIKLRDHRQRAKQRRFVIDGPREILQAARGNLRFAELFVCESLCKTSESRQVLERLSEWPAAIWRVTPEVFEKLAFGDRSDGVLAVAETPRRTLAELIAPAGGLLAVLEGLEKPGNVGAVLRSADGAGVTAVIVADPRTDLYNPNCIRASLGAIFTKPVAEATTGETLTWLRQRGCKIFAARLDATRSYDAVDYRGNAAIVLGSESAGLSTAWPTADVTPIKLPMRGAADSLNVSATAAVLFYEALRQRQ
ncbi:MAG: RNA methyltransferase [Planctomycetia bacterium]|nr:RNA methyltransferase [Planctomycetia bacterium]